jgi:hypothetical protein
LLPTLGDIRGVFVSELETDTLIGDCWWLITAWLSGLPAVTELVTLPAGAIESDSGDLSIVYQRTEEVGHNLSSILKESNDSLLPIL